MDATDAGPPVQVERDGEDRAVAVVALNRPDRRNSLTLEVKDALLRALHDVGGDPTVRAVVLTGRGRAFCVGQDLGEHRAALEADPTGAFDTVGRHYNPIVRTLTTMAKPVVAAVNGSAVGAGLGLALACDLRLAAEGASFATAFAGIGLTADSGLSASLARSVGRSRASELLLLGESIGAEEAEAIGLVRAVVPVDALSDEALALGRRLAAGPTLAFAEIKAGLALAEVADLDTVLEAEGAAQARLGLTSDHRGAVEAFVAKRRPTFDGR